MTWFLSLITGPFFSGLFSTALDGWKAKLASEDTATKAAGDMAARELAVQQTEIQLQQQLKVAEIGHWYEPEKLFAYVVLVYFAKLLIWDKVLGWGVTDSLKGDASTWAGMIMSFYFLKRGFENVARILKR